MKYDNRIKWYVNLYTAGSETTPSGMIRFRKKYFKHGRIKFKKYMYL